MSNQNPSKEEVAKAKEAEEKKIMDGLAAEEKKAEEEAKVKPEEVVKVAKAIIDSVSGMDEAKALLKKLEKSFDYDENGLGEYNGAVKILNCFIEDVNEHFECKNPPRMYKKTLGE